MPEFLQVESSDILDALRIIQLMQNGVTGRESPDEKIHAVRDSISRTQAGQLIGRRLVVGADYVYGKHPDAAPNELIAYTSGLTFIGLLAAYSYLHDEGLSVDTMTLDFEQPELFAVSPASQAAIGQMQLRVPILCITDLVPSHD